MIYEFYKTKSPELPRTIEVDKKADDITAFDIVKGAFRQEPDQLCKLTVEKFAEILAVEVGNHALKTLPFGGVFLIGGVTFGISRLIHDPKFIELFASKGRLSETMTKIPIFLVKEDVELGLLGAEEKAFRNLKIYR